MAIYGLLLVNEETSLGSLIFIVDQSNDDLSLRIDWTLNCIFRLYTPYLKPFKFSTAEVGEEMNSIYGYVQGSSCNMIHVAFLKLSDLDPMTHSLCKKVI